MYFPRQHNEYDDLMVCIVSGRFLQYFSFGVVPFFCNYVFKVVCSKDIVSRVSGCLLWGMDIAGFGIL